MKRLALLLLLLLTAVAGCGTVTPYARTIGTLRPGERITVRIAGGTVNAYAPRDGEPADTYTIDAFAARNRTPAAPIVHAVGGGIDVNVPVVSSLLVRVPRGVNLTVFSARGDVNVTDISGDVRVFMGTGNADLMLPGYGQASISRSGSMKVLVGSGNWKGTLKFFNADGPMTISIDENARFRVHLYTGDGTIFTDFPLRGTARGTSETIDAAVNGGAKRGASIVAKRGMVRLLSLAPQY
ncbi:MAG: hypothetical protein ACREMP_03840 [Candidatus Tyrphobacter sp.]